MSIYQESALPLARQGVFEFANTNFANLCEALTDANKTMSDP